MSKGSGIFETFRLGESVSLHALARNFVGNSILPHFWRRLCRLCGDFGFHRRVTRTSDESKDSGNREKSLQKIFLSVEKNNFSSDNFIVSPDDFFQRLDIKRVFVFQNLRRETFRRIGTGNFDRFLQDDRAVI